MLKLLPRMMLAPCYNEACLDGTTEWAACGYDDTCISTDNTSNGDTVEGFGTWNVGQSDPFSHYFRASPMAPN